ncbi:hypothetical protein A4A49_51951 [Nicotiana attenuata]|uniref:Retroviral polymerase SH3-like domain-containing protein n=1 Tax=Nicotiana attenuata TaxID=49451 RepID=A0A1J6IU87_NICAT|nr:hypothetical protein A4A49_51951 [Nicotiana attenuata]
MTIVNYYEKLTKLWEEHVNFDQIPTCTCEKCICDLGAILEKKREEETVHHCLIGLDEIMYGTVWSNLLAQDPLPTCVKMMARETDERGDVMVFVNGGETDLVVMVNQVDGRRKQQYQTGGMNGVRGRDGAYRMNATHAMGDGISTAVMGVEKAGPPGLSNEQWRLGHPFLQVTKLIPIVDFGKTSDALNKSCDIITRMLCGFFLLIDKKKVVQIVKNFFAMIDRQFRTLQQNRRLEKKYRHILIVVRALCFQGYPYGKKGWKVYNLEKKEYLVSQDVDFYETEFLFSSSTHNTRRDENKEMHVEEVRAEIEEDEIIEEEQLGHEHRQKHTSVYLLDYVTNVVHKLSSSCPPSTSHHHSGDKHVGMPLEQNHRMALAGGRALDDHERYHHLIGQLIYMCFTRPDLSNNIHILSQFMKQPKEDH